MLCARLMLATAALLLSACSQQGSSTLPPQAIASTIGSDFEGIVVVIEDPRTERRKQGFGVGYTARLSYQDDPVLHRTAARIAKDHGLNIISQWPLRSLGVHCFVIQRPDAQRLASLSADPRVKWVQPFNDFAVQTDAAVNPRGASVSVTRRFLDAVSERGSDVKVAVIDTGADIAHPSLRKSRLRYQNFVNGRGRSNGKQEKHGTAVVGLIAAQSGEQQKVLGLAHSADVHLLRACWQDSKSQGRCNTLTLALALDAAVEIQPDILNLSLTGPYDRVLSELLAELAKQGTLVVAAYDEVRPQHERFPSPQPGVIYAFGVDGFGVDGFGVDGQRSASSSTKDPMRGVLYAPRHAISLAPSAGFGLVSGHSFATPQVAAMAACLIHRYPNAERAEIVNHLRKWLGADPSAWQA